MRRILRTRPSPAMVVALVALVAATAGPALADGVASIARSINGKTIKKGTVRARQLAKNSVTSPKVKDGSLLRQDFKTSEIEALRGAQGPQGPQGPQGEQGPAGQPDTSNFYNKTESDGRFLATTAKAADANTLDGLDSTAFVHGTAGSNYRAFNASQSDTSFVTVPNLGRVEVECTALPQTLVRFRNTSGGPIDAWQDVASTAAVSYSNLADNAALSDVTVNTNASQRVTLQVASSTGSVTLRVAVIELSIHTGGGGGNCSVAAHAIEQEQAF